MDKCNHNHNCQHSATSTSQTLDELDFERGPWSAGILQIYNNDLYPITCLNFQTLKVFQKYNPANCFFHAGFSS